MDKDNNKGPFARSIVDGRCVQNVVVEVKQRTQRHKKNLSQTHQTTCLFSDFRFYLTTLPQQPNSDLYYADLTNVIWTII
jgi:hypothetical protein